MPYVGKKICSPESPKWSLSVAAAMSSIPPNRWWALRGRSKISRPGCRMRHHRIGGNRLVDQYWSIITNSSPQLADSWRRRSSPTAGSSRSGRVRWFLPFTVTGCWQISSPPPTWCMPTNPRRLSSPCGMGRGEDRAAEDCEPYVPSHLGGGESRRNRGERSGG